LFAPISRQEYTYWEGPRILGRVREDRAMQVILA